MLEFDPAKRTNILDTLKMLHGDEGNKLSKEINLNQEEVKRDEVEVKREWKVKVFGENWRNRINDLKKLDLSELDKENFDWEV